jgi:hypothetical protein
MWLCTILQLSRTLNTERAGLRPSIAHIPAPLLCHYPRTTGEMVQVEAFLNAVDRGPLRTSCNSSDTIIMDKEGGVRNAERWAPVRATPRTRCGVALTDQYTRTRRTSRPARATLVNQYQERCTVVLVAVPICAHLEHDACRPSRLAYLHPL